jgi:hypothetical protein
MTTKDEATGNGDKATTKRTRRSRKQGDQVPAVLSKVIAELDKIDDAGRERVLRSVAAYYGRCKTYRGADDNDPPRTPRGA